MMIEIRTDGNINGSEQFSDCVKAVLRTALERNGDRIRRVDVHISDAVSNKSSHDDKCCSIEARRVQAYPRDASGEHYGSGDTWCRPQAEEIGR
jgi:hypothetical protein